MELKAVRGGTAKDFYLELGLGKHTVSSERKTESRSPGIPRGTASLGAPGFPPSVASQAVVDTFSY